jgi:hypothetical protein
MINYGHKKCPQQNYSEPSRLYQNVEHCKDEYYFWIDKTKAKLF